MNATEQVAYYALGTGAVITATLVRELFKFNPNISSVIVKDLVRSQRYETDHTVRQVKIKGRWYDMAHVRVHGIMPNKRVMRGVIGYLDGLEVVRFKSGQDAGVIGGFDTNGVLKCCRGEQAAHAGMTWAFDKQGIADRYQTAKNADLHGTCECPVCGQPFAKIRNAQAFCTNQGEGNCKDFFWNAMRSPNVDKELL